MGLPNFDRGSILSPSERTKIHCFGCGISFLLIILIRFVLCFGILIFLWMSFLDPPFCLYFSLSVNISNTSHSSFVLLLPQGLEIVEWDSFTTILAKNPGFFSGSSSVWKYRGNVQPRTLVWITGLDVPPPCYVTLSQSPNLSETPFPHLSNERVG